MHRICGALIVVMLAASLAEAGQTGARCDTARDLLQSTLSRLQPGAGAAVLQEAAQNLRRATDLCPGLADAYYFLSLVMTELKDQPRADNARLKAEFYQSAAMRNKEPLLSDERTSAPAIVSSTPRPGTPSSAVPQVAVSPIVRQKMALVVGVSRFKDSRINALKYTTRDADAVATALEKEAGFDYVKRLLDEEATQRNLKTEIDRLARMATPDDLVVLYVSSHGSPENLDTAGVNYIVTHDTEVNNLYATAVRMDELLDAITERVKAERVIAFLDTCYSGGTFRELPTGWNASSRSVSAESGVALSRIQDRLSRGSRALVVDDAAGTAAAAKGRTRQGLGRVIITSSSQAERSWEDDRIKHGYFTYYMLEALRKPGLVSVDDLFDHIRVRVPSAVLSDKKESQHPSIARSRDRVELYLKDLLP